MATLQHLRDYARRQARDAVGPKADAIIDRAINDAVAQLARERPWTWYHTHGSIALRAAQTLVVSCTTGSATATANTAPTLTDALFLKLIIGGKWYRLTAVSGTTLTLASAWLEPTGAYSATLCQDEYAMPADCLRLARVFPGPDWVWGPEPCGFEDVLAALQAWQVGQRAPRLWAIYRNRIALWPWPSSDTAVNILYYRMPATMTNNADVADWDPLHDELLLRAIDYQLAIQLGSVVAGDAGTCRQLYLDALARAVKAERTPQWYGAYTPGGPADVGPDIVYAP